MLQITDLLNAGYNTPNWSIVHSVDDAIAAVKNGQPAFLGGNGWSAKLWKNDVGLYCGSFHQGKESKAIIGTSELSQLVTWLKNIVPNGGGTVGTGTAAVGTGPARKMAGLPPEPAKN